MTLISHHPASYSNPKIPSCHGSRPISPMSSLAVLSKGGLVQKCVSFVYLICD